MKLSAQIYYTLLHPSATVAQLEQLCREAEAKTATAICVAPLFVSKAKELLGNTSIKVCTTIGYPYGYSIVEAKLAEIIMAMVDDCDEMEVYINLTALKNEDWQYLASELSSIGPIIQKKNKIFSVAISNSFLTDDELVKCCDLYGIAGVNIFSLVAEGESSPIELQRIQKLHTHLADSVKVKVASKHHTEHQLLAIQQAGADIISLPFTVK